MLYHIKLSKEMLNGAKIAVLPGDPGRVKTLAEIFDSNSTFLAQNREYTSYLSKIGNEHVVTCSTGIGGPSLSIAVEELAQLGIKYFIRPGTTGGLQEKIDIGDFIISTGAVRLDGASTHFAPINYPAVPSFDVASSLVEACKNLNLNYHTGITASSDTFYPGQERYNTYSRYVVRHLQGTMDEWKKLNVLNFEMEAATLFTMTSSMGLKAGCVCAVIANRTRSEKPDDTVLKNVEINLGKIVKETILILVNK